MKPEKTNRIIQKQVMFELDESLFYKLNEMLANKRLSKKEFFTNKIEKELSGYFRKNNAR